jgi:hemolysin D
MSGVLKTTKPARRSRSELEFLPAALEVLETPASPAGRAVAATICVFLVGALVWSVLGKVDIVAAAPGSVIPAGRSKIVQPLEAGVVRSILVQDGDHVTAGQTLFALDGTVAAAERDRIARELRQAALDAAGLLVLRRDLATGQGLGSFTAPEGAPAREVEMTLASIAARRGEQAGKLASLDQQIAQKRAELAENAATIAKLTESLPIIEQKETLRTQLLKVEFSNKLAYLDAKQAAIEARHDLIVQQTRTPDAEAAIDALRRQREQTQAGYAHDVLKDLAEAEQKGDL